MCGIAGYILKTHINYPDKGYIDTLIGPGLDRGSLRKEYDISIQSSRSNGSGQAGCCPMTYWMQGNSGQ